MKIFNLGGINQTTEMLFVLEETALLEEQCWTLRKAGVLVVRMWLKVWFCCLSGSQ